ncbi:hypothetical protein ASG16_011940 [Brevibacillus sp. Leaf182]|nr:hypothetical protein ASG16_011940 [Brevibacillus sp. Leaf182]
MGKKPISSLRFGLRPAVGWTVRSGLNGGSRFKSSSFDEVFAELKLKALPPFSPPLCRAAEALGLEIRFFYGAIVKNGEPLQEAFFKSKQLESQK